jgi:translation initiation factor IF-2
LSENTTVKPDDEFKSIKRLIAFSEKSAGEFNAFLAAVQSARQRLEKVYKIVRERERALADKQRAKEAEERRIEEKRRLADKLRAKEEKDKEWEDARAASGAAQPDFGRDAAQPAPPAAEPAPRAATPETPSAGAQPQTKPVEAKPFEVKPVETKPVETKPVEVKPLGVKPLEAKPLEAKPPAMTPEELVKSVPKVERPSFNTGRKIDLGRLQEESPGTRSRQFGSGGRTGGGGTAGAGGQTGYKRPAAGAPAAGAPFRSGAASGFSPDRARGGDKKKDAARADEKKGAMNKRTLIRKGYVVPEGDGDERMGSRRLKNRKVKEEHVFTPIKIERAVITTENLTVKILSEKIGKTANDIIKQLMALGIMTTINSIVDFPTMELVANELGVELELRLDKTKEEQLQDIQAETNESDSYIRRPPIVAVMGHVNHGKTSLLDALRKTSVAQGEAGGITQHIGAYTITAGGNNERITFIDTPGHEAFTAMRARGAGVTDIAVIVVAADDGIMPQTVEAINHVKAANVPIIVALNKIDKTAADSEKIKQQLSEHGVLTEEWGGDTIMSAVSAKTGAGLDKLIENILLVAEVSELRADPARAARGTIIEAQLDKGRGPVATIIVQNGTLRVGDTVVAGMATGKVRALIDDTGANVKEAAPSMPVVVLGFTDVPNAGDILHAVADEKFSRQLADERRDKLKANQTKITQKVTLEEVLERTSDSTKTLNIIIKADVQGSVEALRGALTNLSTDAVKVAVVHGGAGAINKSDVLLAEAARAMIVGFNVKPDNEAKAAADNGGINIRLYKVIYEAIDDISAAAEGMLDPVYEDRITGHAEVRNLFNISDVGVIAGSYVLDGKIVRGGKARVKRGAEVVFDGQLAGLKRFKDDVKEVAAGYECGISVDGFNAFAAGDLIEAYTTERVK